VGKSKLPLSSREIEKAMIKSGIKESNSPYIYMMLENLVPKGDERKMILCRWDKVPGDTKEENRLIRGLDELFKLGWAVHDQVQRDALRIKRSDGTLTIENEYSKSRIKVEQFVGYRGAAMATIRVYANGNETLSRLAHIGSDDKKLFMYRDMEHKVNPPMKYLDYYYRSRPHYLDHMLDDKSNKIISEISKQREQSRESRYRDVKRPKIIPVISKEEAKMDDQIIRIQGDRSKWRFYLNVRGLLQYLLGEIELQNKEKKVHNKRITTVLENLSDNYPQEFPFLLYYSDFAKEFERLRAFAEIPKGYEVELLKKIAEELKNQVEWAKEDFLNYWVTRRYSGEITYYFASAWRTGQFDIDDEHLHLPFRKMREYQMTNLQVMAEYLKSENDIVNNMYYDRIDSDRILDFNLYVYF
jgi:hypothetical protein